MGQGERCSLDGPGHPLFCVDPYLIHTVCTDTIDVLVFYSMKRWLHGGKKNERKLTSFAYMGPFEKCRLLAPTEANLTQADTSRQGESHSFYRRQELKKASFTVEAAEITI